MNLNIHRRINKFDINVLLLIKKHLQNKYLDKLMRLMTFLGNLGVIWIAIAVALILNKPYEGIGKVVLVTLIISTIIGEGLIKHIVRRERPFSFQDISLLIKKPITYSFPSGHTFSSFAVSGVLSVYFTQYRMIFLSIAFLIALSRIYLYLHYPTDVIAGIVFGLLCSKLIFFIMKEEYLQKLVTKLAINN